MKDLSIVEGLWKNEAAVSALMSPAPVQKTSRQTQLCPTKHLCMTSLAFLLSE